jgi:sterol desaturase/sphingolipid hydroxylase (fatty acid hydroxylase superfamily)
MPVRLNMLKAGRHHVFYFLLRGLIVWVLLLLIEAPPRLIVWQMIAVLITGNIDHANIDCRSPTFMHRLLVTPQFHRVHQSADAGQGNSNYGVMLPIWDMLFGTHTDPMRVEALETGIEGDPFRMPS